MLQALAKFTRTGLASLGLRDAGVRGDLVFATPFIGVARNPALRGQFFSYSTSSSLPSFTSFSPFTCSNPSCPLFNNSPVTPAVTYPDAEASKSKILKDNKGKAGVYCWTNKVNGKSYIGSSCDLGRRFSQYYSKGTLQRFNMLIYKALLKYGHSSFKLEILEYCEPKQCLAREQDYIDRVKQYNILPLWSPSGSCHSESRKAKIGEASRKAWLQRSGGSLGSSC